VEGRPVSAYARYGETSPEPRAASPGGQRRARPPAIGFETSSSLGLANRLGYCETGEVRPISGYS